MSESPTRILLVAATEGELPMLDWAKLRKLSISTMATGVGMVATTFALTKELQEVHYDLVVNLGIAGSFTDQIVLGEVVQVSSDQLVELGVEDHDRFIPADEMNLVHSNDLKFQSNVTVENLRSARGITVNRVHGNERSIRKVVEQFNPEVESMEGAAVAYVCSKMNLNWVQFRSISNKVELRNRNAWNIPLAIENLHKEVLVYLEHLNDEA